MAGKEFLTIKLFKRRTTSEGFLPPPFPSPLPPFHFSDHDSLLHSTTSSHSLKKGTQTPVLLRQHIWLTFSVFTSPVLLLFLPRLFFFFFGDHLKVFCFCAIIRNVWFYRLIAASSFLWTQNVIFPSRRQHLRAVHTSPRVQVQERFVLPSPPNKITK